MTWIGTTLLVVAINTMLIGVNAQRVAGQVAPLAPLSSVIAITHTQHRDIAAFVKACVDAYVFSKSDPCPFPLSPGVTDTVRVLQGLHGTVLVKWLDPLTSDTSAEAPRFGANNDYIAYFGDDWDRDWHEDIPGSAPQFNGSGQAGWLWINHEYISNDMPTRTRAPSGQHLTFARFLRAQGILMNTVEADDGWTQADIDTYIRQHKRQLGGSWFRVVWDQTLGHWRVDRNATAVRFDATSRTLGRVTGQTLSARDHDDTGNPLPPGVVAGILANCSGGQTPWGTIITAEENQQDYYGDLESCWDSNQKLVAHTGCDPGRTIALPVTASTTAEFGRISPPHERHSRESYGYLVEIDPRVAPAVSYTSVNAGGNGLGHRKIGAMGRARWENVAIVVDGHWRLHQDKPVVLYAGDDRPGGRIYKWVSKSPYTAGMTRGQIRALLDEGRLFVAHFAGLDNRTGLTLVTGQTPTPSAPGAGQWIHLSVTSTDIVPNAEALGVPKTTVGAALKDVSWNKIAGFSTDHDVRRALFTASAKIGVMELNRPEDLEWNPKDPSGTPRLYVAFTKHTYGTQLDQAGKLLDSTVTEKRNDHDGAIFVIQEADPDNPGVSTSFTYFQAWKGSAPGGNVFAAANPDNLMIDREGGVWFGTDGTFARTNGHSADALYYLDLTPAHHSGRPGVLNPSFGTAFRVVAVPSDAEATGPAFSADMKTIFLSVQHPGEHHPSTWPQDR